MSKRPHITEMTRKNLIDSFWKIYQTKSIERISVREITDMAGYNRGTFYLYFRDIYDVLDSVESDVINMMNAEIERYRAIFKSTGFEPTVEEITSAAIDICQKCEFKPLILLSDRGDSGFERKLRETMYKDLSEKVDGITGIDECTKEYTVSFFISGVIGVLKKWYNEGMVIPVEQHLAAVCNVLFGKKVFNRNSESSATGKEG